MWRRWRCRRRWRHRCCRTRLVARRRDSRAALRRGSRLHALTVLLQDARPSLRRRSLPRRRRRRLLKQTRPLLRRSRSPWWRCWRRCRRRCCRAGLVARRRDSRAALRRDSRLHALTVLLQDARPSLRRPSLPRRQRRRRLRLRLRRQRCCHARRARLPLCRHVNLVGGAARLRGLRARPRRAIPQHAPAPDSVARLRPGRPAPAAAAAAPGCQAAEARPPAPQRRRRTARTAGAGRRGPLSAARRARRAGGRGQAAQAAAALSPPRRAGMQ